MKLPFAWEHIAGVIGLLLLLFGNYQGLFVAPAEVMMGDVARILYVHVPAAWLSLVSFTVAFIAALGYLFNGKMSWDSAVEASCEVGVMLCTLLIILGSIFARPTWGWWWTWDPRLTASAIMLLTFIGVLMLRATVNEPSRRALLVRHRHDHGLYYDTDYVYVSSMVAFDTPASIISGDDVRAICVHPSCECFCLPLSDDLVYRPEMADSAGLKPGTCSPTPSPGGPMTGELQGHWEYVTAAYVVTWLFFGGYTLSLWYRARQLAVSNSDSSPAPSPGGSHE